MAPRVHPLHRKIADLVSENLPQDCRLVRDEACGGRQHIPLFVSRQKAFKTQLCNVDLLVLKEGKIRFIIEIEESNIKPINILGKLLASALSRYYIHENEKTPVAMDDYVVFIQVVDASKLEKGDSKHDQWRIIERSIKSILPFRKSAIKEYRIFYHNQIDNLIYFIKKLCG